MVFADVEQDADARIERRRKIDLVGRALDDMMAAGARRLQREDGHADIAAAGRLVAGRRQDVGDERRGGRLAVGAGDGDERRVRRVRAALAAKQLDVADHLDGGVAREADGPVRRRMGQRTPGASTRAATPDQSRWRGSAMDMPGAGGVGDLLAIVIERSDLGAAGLERAAGRKARAAEPEHRDAPSREGGDRDQEKPHRSFSVDRPASASTTETIQNRITICGSVQPSCSK